MNSNYNIPIIPPNLRREETMVQIADTLHYLVKVTDDVFSRINSRIESNSKRLSSIQDRIKTAETKIEKLAGEKKAVQIFSSCKYPAANINHKYVSVFGCDNKIQLKRTKYKYSETSNTKEEPTDRLEYYHVKTKKLPTKYDSKGLGKIPEDIDFFTDLLLFNTGKNLYKDYVMFDALESTQITKSSSECNISNLEDAPISINNQISVNTTDEESYFYLPDLGEVPSLEVPMDLPDLPGVADDLRYQTEESFAIAPSVAMMTPSDSKSRLNILGNSSNSLSFVSDSSMAESSNETNKEKNNNSQNLEEPIQLKTELKPSVNSETPKETPIFEKNPCYQTELSPKTIDTIENAISSNDSIKEEITKNEKQIDLPIQVADNNAHASLMEAIRKAGGIKNAKLKSATKQETEKNSKGGGDLMADLHAKLSLRRKGISGAKNEQNIDASSTLAKLSSLIPPPPLVSSSEGERDDTEDDWDD